MNAKGQRVFEYDYKQGEGVDLRLRWPRLMQTLFPQQARQHWLASQKEMLLAMRSLLDAAISRVEEREARQEQRRREIKVE